MGKLVLGRVAEESATLCFMAMKIDCQRPLRSCLSPIVVLLALCSAVLAQETNPQKVTSAYAILTTSVDTKSATEGQQLSLRIVADLVVKGVVVIPRESTV